MIFISEEIEPHPKYILVTILMASMITLVPVSSASSIDAKDIQITTKYVKATAKCSCGLNSYTYITGTFENYCPTCHSYGTLVFNPKGTPEGEWTCLKCDSDYCAADGKEKMPGSSISLKPYNAPEVSAKDSIKIKVKTAIVNYKHKNFLETE